MHSKEWLASPYPTPGIIHISFIYKFGKDSCSHGKLSDPISLALEDEFLAYLKLLRYVRFNFSIDNKYRITYLK